MISQQKSCAACGQGFPRKRAHGSDVTWEATKYCSRACFGLARRTHGQTKSGRPTPTYRAWVNMKTRCENPNSTQYGWYGARGISVDPRWQSYEQFFADVGERPSSRYSLDRFPDVDGNYEPGNVRWATIIDQQRNRRSNRAVVCDDGRTFGSLAEAAESVAGTISGIWDACQGKSKSHRGRSWRYA